MKLSYDLLNNMPRREISKGTFNLLTKLQDEPDQVKIAAPCALFLLLCQHYNVAPEEVFRMTSNALAYDQEQATEEHFGATRAFLRHEMGY